LKRRQEELEKRAQELERREAELRNNPQNGKFIKEKSTLNSFPHCISALKIIIKSIQFLMVGKSGSRISNFRLIFTH
jgi:hypothetical protein